MIPLSQIISRVRTRYESLTQVRWSDDKIAKCINEGLQDLSEVTRFYERHVTVPIIANRNYYDLRGWMPEEALGVTSIWCSARTTWLEPTTIGNLRSRWEQSVGPPIQFLMRGFYWLTVWPKSSSDSGFMRVYFEAQAPSYGFSQAVLRDLTDDHILALEDYALYELAAQDGESAMALSHFEDYDKRSKALADFKKNRLKRARTIQMGRWNRFTK